MRSGSMPLAIITCDALPARSAPNAKLYSVEPRSSQRPCIVIFTSGFCFIYKAWAFRFLFASAEISAESKAKYTCWPFNSAGARTQAASANMLNVSVVLFIISIPLMLYKVVVSITYFIKRCQHTIFCLGFGFFCVIM